MRSRASCIATSRVSRSPARREVKEVIPTQLYQCHPGRIGGKIIARESVSAMAQGCDGECYGGDISRNASSWKSRRKQKADESIGR